MDNFGNDPGYTPDHEYTLIRINVLLTCLADADWDGGDTVTRQVERRERLHIGDGVRNLADFVLREVKFFAAGQSDNRTHVGDVVTRQASHFQPLELAELGRQNVDLVVGCVQHSQPLRQIKTPTTLA